MRVEKRTLLLLACVVWTAAGANILRIGIEEYAGNLSPVNVALSLAVCAVFWSRVFGRLVGRHTARIRAYEGPQAPWRFFDAPSFAVMALMMGAGVTIRAAHLAPAAFVAVFYTGLGAALAAAGLLFGRNWLRLA